MPPARLAAAAARVEAEPGRAEPTDPGVARPREKAADLIRYIDSLDYNMYWHTPPLFNPQNYAGNAENAFGKIVSINMLCCPKSLPQQIVGGLKVEVPSA